ncbi:hypothetical protein HJFPF1_02800 [Paramyrothecium foliicola]|nr:hypothetical protein HJFPF1_02800 [Paramyrothecium foliicola]
MAPTLRRTAAKAEADADADAGAALSEALYDPLAVAAADDAAASAATALTAPATLQLQRRLPVAAQFPLVSILSFAIASLGYSLLGEVSKGELAAIYLLNTFYSLSPVTAVSALLVDIVSAAVPFYLLRPLSAVHKPGAKVHNRELIDIPLQLYTTALSTTIYTVTLVLSLRMILPRILILYFAGLPTLEPAYGASYATVLPATLAFGAAASVFIFAPFATTGKAKEDDKLGEFDPVSASLGETVWWNAWGYTAKTKVIIRRTVIASLVTGINTYLATTMTVYGIEPTGAAAYASVWVFAAVCSGTDSHHHRPAHYCENPALSSPPAPPPPAPAKPPLSPLTQTRRVAMAEYYGEGSSSGAYSSSRQFKRSRSIRSDDPLDLQGPLEIEGSVKSGGSINLQGDFVVRDKIDAYGAIHMNGSISCGQVTPSGRIKAYGNIVVNGYLASSDKIKGYGKLRVVGTLDGDELEIYGNLSITGYLKCRRLVLYGSLTLIGPDSNYLVEEYEEVAGAKLVREQEPDWDW